MVLNLPYLLLLLPASLAWYAQLRVRAAYERYGRVANSRGILGADVAEALLAHLGLRQRVSIYLTPGYLNDHYDTRDKALYLTEGIAASRSVTAMGIVAHEVLHAQQDAEGYPLMRLRSWLGERLGNLPRAASWAILVGLLFHWTLLVIIGGVALLGTMLLVLTALPVERNQRASAGHPAGDRPGCPCRCGGCAVRAALGRPDLCGRPGAVPGSPGVLRDADPGGAGLLGSEGQAFGN